jgi:hypothetical protein
MHRLLLSALLVFGVNFAFGDVNVTIPPLQGKVFSNLATWQTFNLYPGQLNGCTQINIPGQTRYICSVFNGMATVGAPGQIGQGTINLSDVTIFLVTNSDGTITRTYQFNGNYLETAAQLARHSKATIILAGTGTAAAAPSYQGSVTLNDYGVVNGIEAQ